MPPCRKKRSCPKQDRDLFVKIHDAEQRGGIDYLKSKYKTLPSDYVVTLFKDTGFAREVLTVSGDTMPCANRWGRTRWACFKKRAYRSKMCLICATTRGRKFSCRTATLTDSGFYVYNEALRGRRAFLLPGDGSASFPGGFGKNRRAYGGTGKERLYRNFAQGTGRGAAGHQLLRRLPCASIWGFMC